MSRRARNERALKLANSPGFEPDGESGELRKSNVTFGTCWARRRRLAFQRMETTIRKFWRRGVSFYYWLGLAGMVGLGYFCIHHPTDYAMPVFLAYMAGLVIFSQIICWELKADGIGTSVVTSDVRRQLR
jgi:hypothetical protein